MAAAVNSQTIMALLRSQTATAISGSSPIARLMGDFRPPYHQAIETIQIKPTNTRLKPAWFALPVIKRMPPGMAAEAVSNVSSTARSHGVPMKRLPISTTGANAARPKLTSKTNRPRSRTRCLYSPESGIAWSRRFNRLLILKFTVRFPRLSSNFDGLKNEHGHTAAASAQVNQIRRRPQKSRI